MKSRLLSILLAVALFLLPIVCLGQSAPNLGATSGFALFTAGGAFDSYGATHIAGNIGSYTATPTIYDHGTVNGTIYNVGDPALTQPLADVSTVYSNLTQNGLAINVVLDSLVLAPGVYTTGAASSLSANGELTLDGHGDPNAIFIIRINGAFATGASAKVTLKNFASPSNVYWQINGAFSLGDSSVFIGNIVSTGAIVLLEGSSLIGRGLTTAGEIHLHNNIVTCPNLWMGTSSSTAWNVGTNWTAGFVPGSGDDVIFAPTPNNDLVLDNIRIIGNLTNTSAKRLVIPAGKSLTINGNINTNNDASKIYIQSSSSGPNGSLIFSTDSLVYGTVEMYSKASHFSPIPDTINGNPTTISYTWQFFGIPLHSMSQISPTLDGAYVRQMHENDSTSHWEQLTNASSMSSFIGYEITQTAPTTYIFQGRLENAPLTNLQLKFTNTTPAVSYPGQNLIGNPYTAAIEISKIVFRGNILKTVYIYNTGSYAEWASQTEDSIDSKITPGQYTAIPKNLAGTAGLQNQIPSMQAFLVKAKDNTATLSILYSTVGTVVSDSVPLRAPGIYNSDVSSNNVWTIIDVKGSQFSDRMWIFTVPTCTHGFDNGWDGEKIMGSGLAPQLFAMETDGNYQVDAVDDISNTVLGFQRGVDTEYTLTFTQQNISSKYAGIYLVDLVENKTVDITKSGSTYSFTAGSTSTPVKRFMIITRTSEEEETADAKLKLFSSGNKIFIQNSDTQAGEMIVYDMLGCAVKSAAFGPYSITTVQPGASGAYVVKATTGNERATKKVIIGE